MIYTKLNYRVQGFIFDGLKRDYLDLIKFAVQNLLKENFLSYEQLKRAIIDFMFGGKHQFDWWLQKQLETSALCFLKQHPDIIHDEDFLYNLWLTMNCNNANTTNQILRDLFIAGMKPCLEFEAICPQTKVRVKVRPCDDKKGYYALDVGNIKEALFFFGASNDCAHPFVVYYELKRKKKPVAKYLTVGVQMLTSSYVYGEGGFGFCNEAVFQYEDSSLRKIIEHHYVSRSKTSIILGPDPVYLKNNIIQTIYNGLKEAK